MEAALPVLGITATLPAPPPIRLLADWTRVRRETRAAREPAVDAVRRGAQEPPGKRQFLRVIGEPVGHRNSENVAIKRIAHLEIVLADTAGVDPAGDRIGHERIVEPFADLVAQGGNVRCRKEAAEGAAVKLSHYVSVGWLTKRKVVAESTAVRGVRRVADRERGVVEEEDRQSAWADPELGDKTLCHGVSETEVHHPEKLGLVDLPGVGAAQEIGKGRRQSKAIDRTRWGARVGAGDGNRLDARNPQAQQRMVIRIARHSGEAVCGVPETRPLEGVRVLTGAHVGGAGKVVVEVLIRRSIL